MTRRTQSCAFHAAGRDGNLRWARDGEDYDKAVCPWCGRNVKGGDDD